VQADLGVGFEASRWVANPYLLTLAGLILFGGSVMTMAWLGKDPPKRRGAD
jgi:hypothetical protein